MKKQPLLILCVSFILGIFSQDFFILSGSQIYISLTFSFVLIFSFLVKNFYVYKFRNFSLVLLFFSLGMFAHFQNMKKPELPELSDKEFLYFKLSKKLNSNEKNKRYEVVAWKENESFRAVLSVPKQQQELDFQHYYRANVYVNKIPETYSDFQFDYAKYLSRKDIYYQIYLPESYQSGVRDDLSLSEKIRQQRLETLSKIDQTALSKRTREFTKGIILADRTEMDREAVQDFQKSGLMHVMAISGSHMAIIFWLILLFLNPIFPPKIRNIKIVIALAIIWAFAIFIDYGSSVVRSSIMLSCYYTYVLLQRKTDLLHSMAVAAFIILIADTRQLFDVGFQLSFCAVLGIFWLNRPILKHFPVPKNKIQSFLVNLVSVSVAAQIATLPLVIYYFHQWSFISIIANLIIVPVAEILIIFALLMTVLIAFSLQFSWLNLIYDSCVSGILKLIHGFADLDFAYFKIIPMSLPEVMTALIVIYFLRFAVLKSNLKNISRVAYFLVVFVALRLLLNYKAGQINEVLVHPYFNQKIISIKHKDKVKFFVPEEANRTKIEAYILEPYLTARRTKNFELQTVDEDIEKIKINGKEYQFR